MDALARGKKRREDMHVVFYREEEARMELYSGVFWEQMDFDYYGTCTHFFLVSRASDGTMVLFFSSRHKQERIDTTSLFPTLLDLFLFVCQLVFFFIVAHTHTHAHSGHSADTLANGRRGGNHITPKRKKITTNAY